MKFSSCYFENQAKAYFCLAVVFENGIIFIFFFFLPLNYKASGFKGSNYQLFWRQNLPGGPVCVACKAIFIAKPDSYERNQ